MSNSIILRGELLVTGATGNVGSLVVKSLLKAGCKPRIMVRDRCKAEALFGKQIGIALGDFSDAASMHAAFAGASSVLLITSGPALAEYDRAAAAAAKIARVEHLVKLSSFDAEHGVGTGVWHARGEAAIRDSGISFTFVRPSGFMSNALWWATSINKHGVVRSSTGAGRIAFIHPRDIAAVTANVLLARGKYRGETLPITGPEALSYSEMAQRIGLAIRKPVGFEGLSEQEARDQQRSWGAEPALIEARLSIFRAIREGRLRHVTDTVERILGRKPLSFSTWAKENTATFT
jgi:uncharacterized protein YbjT (DUF2867 family)